MIPIMGTSQDRFMKNGKDGLVQNAHPQGTENSSRFIDQSQNICTVKRAAMRNSLSQRMKPAKRHNKIVSIPKNRLKGFFPIIRSSHYIGQIHEIRILNSSIDWPPGSAIFLLTFFPTLAHRLWDPPLNPVWADFLAQSLLYDTTEALFKFYEYLPVG